MHYLELEMKDFLHANYYIEVEPRELDLSDFLLSTDLWQVLNGTADGTKFPLVFPLEKHLSW